MTFLRIGIVACLVASASTSGAAIAAAATGQTAAHPAPLLQGAPNFRDLGGYVTADGRQVRKGMVYRSDALSGLTPADLATLNALHIQSVIDLRSREEQQAAPDRWLQRPAFNYASPKPSMKPIMQALFHDISSPAAARAGMTGFYATLPDQYRPELSVFFKRLAMSDTPMVIHCTGGKDRTGVASALLLEALGVSRSDIIADYALTAQRLAAQNPDRPKTADLPGGAAEARAQFAALPPAIASTFWQSDPVYVEAALDAVDRQYGSIDGYLRKGVGMSTDDIARLRASLTR